MAVVTIINQKNDHRLCGECVKRISEEKRMDKERLDAGVDFKTDVRTFFGYNPNG